MFFFIFVTVNLLSYPKTTPVRKADTQHPDLTVSATAAFPGSRILVQDPRYNPDRFSFHMSFQYRRTTKGKRSNQVRGLCKDLDMQAQTVW